MLDVVNMDGVTEDNTAVALAALSVEIQNLVIKISFPVECIKVSPILFKHEQITGPIIVCSLNLTGLTLPLPEIDFSSQTITILSRFPTKIMAFESLLPSSLCSLSLPALSLVFEESL